MPLIRQKGEEQDYSIGNIRAYSNMYFSPKNFESFKEDPAIKINQKDQDFAIYRNITLTVKDESINISVPVVSMECKTYLDKTMLEGSIATAEKIKMGNPYCLFFIVTETYDVSYDVDPIYSRIDAIFVLRKQKRPRNGRLNPISYEVVYDLDVYKRQMLACLANCCTSAMSFPAKRESVTAVCLRPVSYTHLDVYKRQGGSSAIKGWAFSYSLSNVNKV